MMKISLLVMPFMRIEFPSIALTQIKARLKEIFNDQIEVSLFYINFEFYRSFGAEAYSVISELPVSFSLNEWIFRQEAFDNVKNNQEDYTAAYFRKPEELQQFSRYQETLNYMGDFIDQIIMKYRLASFDLVGISSTFSVVPGLAFFRHLKRLNKQIITVMGGANVYKKMGQTLVAHYPYLDYACSGSGLISFPKLVNAILQEDRNAANSIHGILSKTNIGTVNNVSEELDINHPIDLDYGNYLENLRQLQVDNPIKPNLLLETSRGCSWRKCKFCGLNEDQAKYRLKQKDIATAEINRYFKKYDADIMMVDTMLPRHYINEVLPYLNVPGNHTLAYETRADYTKQEIKTLRLANVKSIQAGVESLSSPVLELMDKGVNAFQCIAMLKLCTGYLIHVAWNILIGFPGMTVNMYEQLISTIKNVTHLYPPSGSGEIAFLRYNEYCCKKEKYPQLKLSPLKSYEYIYPYGKEFLADFAYFFEDIHFGSERVHLLRRYSPIFQQLVEQWRKRWNTPLAIDLPKLYCYDKDGKPYIYDSRQQVQEYEISPLQAKILTLLQEPCKQDSLNGHFPGAPPGIVEQDLHLLIGKNLIFKEKDQLMSLLIENYHEKFFQPVSTKNLFG